MKHSIIALALAATVNCSLAEETFYFSAVMSGTNEVPPATTYWVVRGTFALTGKTLHYGSLAEYMNLGARGLVGGLPSLRGPALPGTNGPVVSALRGGFVAPHPPQGVGGIYFYGQLSLSGQEIAYLFAGLLYVDNGLFRGQILLDSDLDFIPDSQDQCLNSPSDSLVDSDGCTIEQVCPCEAPWKGHGEYVSCIQSTTAKFVSEGLITEERRLELLKQAGQSDCGKRQRH